MILTPIRPDQKTQNGKQRRLAGTGSALDRQEISPLHCQIDPTKNLIQSLRTIPEMFPDSCHLYQCHLLFFSLAFIINITQVQLTPIIVDEWVWKSFCLSLQVHSILFRHGQNFVRKK